jgi:hypothetical protein
MHFPFVVLYPGSSGDWTIVSAVPVHFYGLSECRPVARHFLCYVMYETLNLSVNAGKCVKLK